MEKLLMCRICLAENVRMYVVVNKNLHELYERLTDNPFITKDNRPMLACFFCCTKLKQCCRFQGKCLEAEEVFTQMLNEDYEPKPLINQDHLQCINGFIQSPMVHVSIGDEYQTESDDIKEELPAVCEEPHDIIEPKEEHLSDELELENLNNSYSDKEDMPAQQSESDLEDDLALMEIKTEVEEEKEESRKTRRASDTQRAPVAKNPQLHIRRTEQEDVITEKQKKNEQLDTKITQNSQNCTSKTVTNFKEPSLTNKLRVNNTNENRIHTGEKPFICDICQRCFSQKANLSRHIRVHTGEKSFKCDVCQSRFREKAHLLYHIRLHTGEKPFKCDVCQRSFKNKITLTSHISTHTHGAYPFKCDVCQRCFSQKAYLTIHNRVHAGEKRFKCDICQRCFSQNAHLTDHIRLHTGEKPFNCDICQRSFRHKISLKSHIRTQHTHCKKPFKCDICQRCFRRNITLKSHIRTHTLVEKPFKCDVCQRCFSQKVYLTIHNRRHAVEKRFKCDICQRCFSQKGHLTDHIRLHTGEKPFKCDICQRSFRHKRNLIRHTRHMHTNYRER